MPQEPVALRAFLAIFKATRRIGRPRRAEKTYRGSRLTASMPLAGGFALLLHKYCRIITVCPRTVPALTQFVQALHRRGESAHRHTISGFARRETLVRAHYC